MNKKYIIFILCMAALVQAARLSAQEANPAYVIPQPDGKFLMNGYILPNGDTLLYVELREIEIKAPKFFASADDYKRYERYKRYAASVVPYALNAVKTYREMEAATRDLSSREKKRYIKNLQNTMEAQLRAQLKNLTRTQGFLLVEMIEKELHMSFYDLVKDVQGGFTAFYWNEFGKMYNYRLKEAYIRGNDPILDAVLDQYDLSHYR